MEEYGRRSSYSRAFQGSNGSFQNLNNFTGIQQPSQSNNIAPYLSANSYNNTNYLNEIPSTVAPNYTFTSTPTHPQFLVVQNHLTPSTTNRPIQSFTQQRNNILNIQTDPPGSTFPLIQSQSTNLNFVNETGNLNYLPYQTQLILPNDIPQPSNSLSNNNYPVSIRPNHLTNFDFQTANDQVHNYYQNQTYQQHLVTPRTAVSEGIIPEQYNRLLHNSALNQIQPHQHRSTSFIQDYNSQDNNLEHIQTQETEPANIVSTFITKRARLEIPIAITYVTHSVTEPSSTVQPTGLLQNPVTDRIIGLETNNPDNTCPITISPNSDLSAFVSNVDASKTLTTESRLISTNQVAAIAHTVQQNQTVQNGFQSVNSSERGPYNISEETESSPEAEEHCNNILTELENPNSYLFSEEANDYLNSIINSNCANVSEDCNTLRTHSSLNQDPINHHTNLAQTAGEKLHNNNNISANLNLQNMFPVTMDQSRQENIPAQHTLQVHMHHLCCPCSNVIYPYYPPGYRPPLLAQPPPIARPSYLHHYQYTQLHVNPAYNIPLPPPMAQHLQQSINHSPPSTVDLAFGPPPRDRRNLDNQDYEEHRQIPDKTKTDNRNSLLQYSPLSMDNACGSVNLSENSQDNFKNLSASQVANLSTENYIRYLDHGCFIGETIAKRNEQRPCFKNIQNLCNRTRSEVTKPNITVSNIHSQGVPWATKDFIFAYVRAINCWCILRGYLGTKDGNLGKIDREISPEFRACYGKWEKCTKQLTHYLIQTFHKLDEANSSPNLNNNNAQSHSNVPPFTPTTTASVSNKGRNQSPPQETPTKVIQLLTETPVVQTEEKKLPNKEMATLKGIPGILHIPPTNSNEIEIRNHNSESTEISPRDEDSDNGSRVYMKPGSYNVPTKQQSNQSNSPRSIEFLDTAKNITVRRRKVSSDKYELSSDVLRDKVWQTAQNVTPEFIKQNEESSPSVVVNNNIEKLYDITVPQNKHIENWLNSENNYFDCGLQDGDEENVAQTEDILQPYKSVRVGKANEATTSRCSSMASNELEVSTRSYRNRPALKSYSGYRRQMTNIWEFKTGGLTDFALNTFERILKELERTEFAPHINLKIPSSCAEDSEIQNPSDLGTIARKLRNKMHSNLNEVIHDFRHIICSSSEYFMDAKLLKQVVLFRDKFEEMITQNFSNIDFTHITGEPNETTGPLIIKQRGRSTKKISDGDGDH